MAPQQTIPELAGSSTQKRTDLDQQRITKENFVRKEYICWIPTTLRNNQIVFFSKNTIIFCPLK
jgi:hypothetical protein